ncbi:hypothetical protein UY3_00499 [Chelonia mydas]|uniref:Uncharacterized protein n=1 Tax=Chelonia mydas TaxID=8469 RepID=M7BYD1_CHEMY|nr:hypothetical protein UY3_00499 [Chelonia mydas]
MSDASETLAGRAPSARGKQQQGFVARYASPNKHNGVEKQKSLFGAAKKFHLVKHLYYAKTFLDISFVDALGMFLVSLLLWYTVAIVDSTNNDLLHSEIVNVKTCLILLLFHQFFMATTSLASHTYQL